MTKIQNYSRSLDIGIWILPFNSAQGGELVEPFVICHLVHVILSAHGLLRLQIVISLFKGLTPETYPTLEYRIRLFESSNYGIRQYVSNHCHVYATPGAADRGQSVLPGRFRLPCSRTSFQSSHRSVQLDRDNAGAG